MNTEEKLRVALVCLRSIAKYGGLLPSDGLAKECLADMGEPADDDDASRAALAEEG